MEYPASELGTAFSTNDLSLAAFMVVRGIKLLSAKRFGRTYRFVLQIDAQKAQALKMAYVNSECAKFDATVRDLKSILFGSNE
jgi:hypothetical protein